MLKPRVDISGLDQSPCLIVVHVDDGGNAVSEFPLHGDFERVGRLRVQRSAGQGGSAVVVFLEGAGVAEWMSVDKLVDHFGRPLIDERQPGRDRVIRHQTVIVVVAQPQVRRPAGAQNHLLLGEKAQLEVRMIDVQLFDEHRAKSIIVLQVPHIPLGLRANREATDFGNGEAVFDFGAEPVAARDVPHILNPFRCFGIEAIVIKVSIIRELPAEVTGRADVARVQQADKVALVAYSISAVAEEARFIPGDRRLLLAVVEIRDDVPASPDQVGERVISALAILATGYSMESLGRIIFRKIERLATIVKNGAGNQQVRSLAEIHRGGDLALSLPETVGFGAEPELGLIDWRLRDHVDGGEHAIAAVQRGRRSPDHFNSLDQVHIQSEILTKKAVGIVNVLGERMPV